MIRVEKSYNWKMAFVFVAVGLSCATGYGLSEKTMLRAPLLNVREKEIDELFKANEALIEKQKRKLDMEYDGMLYFLRRKFKKVLGPLRDGNITVERIKRLLSPEEKDIFDLVSEIRDNQIKASILGRNKEDYIYLRKNTSPDCGVCKDVNKSLAAALIEVLRHKGVKVTVQPFYNLKPTPESGTEKELVHLFVVVSKDEKSIAIDLAFGQYNKGYAGHAVVATYEEHMISVTNALSAMSEERKQSLIAEFLRESKQTIKSLEAQKRKKLSVKRFFRGIFDALCNPMQMS